MHTGPAVKTDEYRDVGSYISGGRRSGVGRRHDSGGIKSDTDGSRRERAQDLHHLPMALAADGTPRGIDVDGGRGVGGGGWRRRAKELPRPGDGGAPLPIGKQPEMPDAHETARQDV